MGRWRAIDIAHARIELAGYVPGEVVHADEITEAFMRRRQRKPHKIRRLPDSSKWTGTPALNKKGFQVIEPAHFT